MSLSSNESLGIVFLHHTADEITRANFASFRRWNPGETIISVSAGDALENGYSIREIAGAAAIWESRTNSLNRRAESADLLLYLWYPSRREFCDKWLIVEWDAYCEMPARDFLSNVWEFPISGPSIRLPNRENEWHWFQHVADFPVDLQPYATGIVPFCFIQIADYVLANVYRLASSLELEAGNCELRLPTLASALGFPAVANPRADGKITWQAHPVDTEITEGMWHPIKWLRRYRDQNA